MSRPLVVLGLSLLAIGPLACSFSYSSASLSKSVESSSHSLGSSSASVSSSSPGAAERAYHDDVRDYTTAFVKSSSGDIQGFQTDLGRLAARHGITNWEENMTTYTAIGEGLAAADVDEASFLAYQRNLSGGDPRKMEAIQKGYAAGR